MKPSVPAVMKITKAMTPHTSGNAQISTSAPSTLTIGKATIAAQPCHVLGVAP